MSIQQSLLQTTDKVAFVCGLLLFGKQGYCSSELRRVCMFGFIMETLSPNPQCIRTSDPLWVAGLKVLKREQVIPRSISSSERGLLAELGLAA